MKVKIISDEQQYRDALAVRRKVFMEEQHVPEDLEIDEYEETATHFVAYDDGGQPIGAGRCRRGDGHCKVERICVLPFSRKQGIGEAIMDKIEQFAREQRLAVLKLHSQTHARRFYERLGYQICSEQEFLDAGIPHVAMRKGL